MVVQKIGLLQSNELDTKDMDKKLDIIRNLGDDELEKLADDPTELEEKIGLPMTKMQNKVVTYKDKIHYDPEEEKEKQAKANEIAEKMKAQGDE